MDPQRPSRGAVAFLHETFPCGGAERVTMDVAQHLSLQGFSVSVITHDHDAGMMPRDIRPLFDIVRVSEPHMSRSRQDAREIVELIRSRDIAVVIFFHALHTLPFIKAATGCRFVYINHGTPLWEPGMVYTAKKDKNHTLWKKLVWQTVYRPRFKWFKTYERKYRRLYLETLNEVEAYIVLCDAYKERLIADLHLTDEALIRKFWVIPNAIPVPAEPRLDKDREIVYVGRLSYSDKRVDRLVEVWRRICDRVPDWQLTLVGDGEYRQALEQQAEGLPRIAFAGWQADVQAYLRRASVLCLVSALESWGLCLMEAQAHGVVPVAFDCSEGVHALLEPSGTNGLLVSPGDLDAYADALLSLLNDPERLKLMQQNVLRKAESYVMAHVGEKWVRLLDHLINGAPRS